MSADPPLIDQHPGDPQSWNLFAYVRNNPLKFVDPTGNAPNPVGCIASCQEMEDVGTGRAGGTVTEADDPAGYTTQQLEAQALEAVITLALAQKPTAADISAGNFISVGQRPLLPGFPVDTWYHAYLEIPVVENGEWTGKYQTYGVLGDEGTDKNQQVRAGDHRNADKLGSDRNGHYEVRVTAAQREELRKGAIYWTQHECPSCGKNYVRGGAHAIRGGYNSNTWVYNMLIYNPAGRIEPPAIRHRLDDGWAVNDVGSNYYPK